MKIYLAGPMTWQPYLNYHAFSAAAHKLRSDGNTVINPVQSDMSVYGERMFFDNPTGDPDKAKACGFDLRECIGRDIRALLWCDAIALLPGSANSTGAMAELTVAKWAKQEVIHL